MAFRVEAGVQPGCVCGMGDVSGIAAGEVPDVKAAFRDFVTGVEDFTPA
jgi:hypothetical protein